MRNLSFILFISIPFFLVKAQVISGFSSFKTYNVQKNFEPCILNLVKGSLTFTDEDGNDRLDANENATISFIIENKGKGSAVGLIAEISVNSNVKGIKIPSKLNLETIGSNKESTITINLKSTQILSTGNVSLLIEIKEPHHLDLSLPPIDFKTLKYQKPQVELIDGAFTSNDPSGLFKKKVPSKLKIIIQNIGQGIARDVNVFFTIPLNILNISQLENHIDYLNPGESREVVFDFLTNDKFRQEKVTILVEVTESTGEYGSINDYSISIDQNLAQSKFVVHSDDFKKTKIEKQYLSSDVDREIPSNNKTFDNKYALVIGNEDYTTKQSSLSSGVNVAFAENDAKSFEKYLITTLGFKKAHIKTVINASSSEINREINWLIELGSYDKKNELLFYYAGHGLPDDDKNSYLVPIDVTLSDLSKEGISLKTLYTKLASSKAAKITVFLDACFSGGGRDQGLVTARGFNIKPKEEKFTGNMVVFSSSSGEERSLTYDEKQHGFFTYFLLKKLKESRGGVSYGDLSDYIYEQVKKNCMLKKSLKQTPHTNVSPSAQGIWEKWSFR